MSTLLTRFTTRSKTPAIKTSSSSSVKSKEKSENTMQHKDARPISRRLLPVVPPPRVASLNRVRDGDAVSFFSPTASTIDSAVIDSFPLPPSSSPPRSPSPSLSSSSDRTTTRSSSDSETATLPGTPDTSHSIHFLDDEKKTLDGDVAHWLESSHVFDGLASIKRLSLTLSPSPPPSYDSHSEAASSVDSFHTSESEIRAEEPVVSFRVQTAPWRYQEVRELKTSAERAAAYEAKIVELREEGAEWWLDYSRVMKAQRVSLKEAKPRRIPVRLLQA